MFTFRMRLFSVSRILLRAGEVGQRVSYRGLVEDCGSEFTLARRRAYVFWP